MLVDYSDSDASDTEASPAPPPPPPKPTSGLAALLPKPKGARKGVTADTGPKKIVVNLPNINDAELDQPRAKKARIGGGGSSLSAMLPAPKKRKEAEAAASKDNGESPSGEVKKPKVLGAKSAGAREVGEVLMPSADREAENVSPEMPQAPVVKGNSTMFVPQSVVGRKTIQPMSAFRKKGTKGNATGSIKVAGGAVPPPKPKVSLFGSATTALAPAAYTGMSGPTAEYKPIMLETAQPAPRPRGDAEDYDGYEDDAQNTGYGALEEPPRDELDDLVNEVGLDEAAVSLISVRTSDVRLILSQQRQLYGRRGRGKEPVNISTFSVDAEYRRNEVDKALGLVEEVKTVRAIQSGKHQLKSLLQSATSQKEALEDQFAQAKRNKKEAGSKYGW